MKLNLLLLLILATLNHSCKGQENKQPETKSVQDTFYEEQKQMGQPIWQYINSNFVVLHSLKESDFTQKIDSFKTIYLNQLNNYKHKLDSTNYADEYLGINAAFDKYILEFPQHHNYITENNIELSVENKRRIDQYLKDFNNADLLTNRDFRAFVISYVTKQSREKLNSGIYDGKDNQQLLADWDVIDNLFSIVEVNCFWKQDYLYNYIDNYGIKNIDSIYKDFMTSCGNSESTVKVSELYDIHRKGRAGHTIETYKQVDGFALEIHLFLPDSETFKGKRPTVVYFHGGSWSEGKPDWFFGDGKDYAKRGWVAAAVEYRIKGRQGTYPFDAVKDAKSAIRWLRKNASQYGIHPNQIIATGNSAGGHLAVAASLVEGYDEENDDLSINAKPNVVMVNSAVYDLTVENAKWIVENKEDKNVAKEISPNSLISETKTKYLLIHGEDDKRCTYKSAQFFYDKMKAIGNKVELHKIENATHFIWFGRHAREVSEITTKYLKGLDLN